MLIVSHGAMMVTQGTPYIERSVVENYLKAIPNSSPYLVRSKSGFDDYSVIVTADPESLARALIDSELFRIGSYSREELEMFRIHRS